jgi:hypothetical protein
VSASPTPSLRDDARTIAWWLALGIVVGGIVGGLVGGVGGRAVMLVLRLSSDADGVVSDDGFTIGSFTLFDSLQLYAGMALFGAVNGLCYVGARQLLPRRFRVALWGAVGAAVVGAIVVKTEGIDFVVLEPRWFAIAAFVALPGAAALAVAAVLERLASLEPWRVPRWSAVLLVPALPAFVALPLAVAGGVLVLAAARISASRRLPASPLARGAALALTLGLVAVGALDLWRDATELL